MLREIAAWLPAVPDNQNAAEHLQHLNELLKDDKVFKQRMALSKKRRELKLVGFDPLPDEYLVELKKMLESQRAILELPFTKLSPASNLSRMKISRKGKADL